MSATACVVDFDVGRSGRRKGSCEDRATVKDWILGGGSIVSVGHFGVGVGCFEAALDGRALDGEFEAARRWERELDVRYRSVRLLDSLSRESEVSTCLRISQLWNKYQDV